MEFDRGYMDYDRQYQIGDGIECPYSDTAQRGEWHRGMEKAYWDHVTNANSM